MVPFETALGWPWAIRLAPYDPTTDDVAHGATWTSSDRLTWTASPDSVIWSLSDALPDPAMIRNDVIATPDG